jgi:SAM-dependent methyltransferase
VVNRSSEIPPPPLARFGCGGEAEIGAGHLQQLRALAALVPDERVLDIGCGAGRTAIPLTAYLSKNGSYEGFDISAEAIEWCRDQVGSRFANFRFTHADVFNAAYNPSGRVQPSELVFPYPSGHFDLVFLYSVFTHMLPKDVERYLSEIARMLKPGGRVLATFFLVNARRLAAFRAAVAADPTVGGGVPNDLLDNDFGDYHAGYQVAEQAVVYKESVVRTYYIQRDLRIKEPILYGEWPEWPSTVRFAGTQDVVLAYRASSR